jgi:hypothetical protein
MQNYFCQRFFSFTFAIASVVAAASTTAAMPSKIAAPNVPPTADEIAAMAEDGVTSTMTNSWDAWVKHAPLQRNWELRAGDLSLHGYWFAEQGVAPGDSRSRFLLINVGEKLVCHTSVGSQVNCFRAGKQFVVPSLTLNEKFELEREICDHGTCHFVPEGNIKFTGRDKTTKVSTATLLSLYELDLGRPFNPAEYFGWNRNSSRSTSFVRETSPNDSVTYNASYSVSLAVPNSSVTDKVDYFLNTWREVEHQFTTTITLNATGSTHSKPIFVGQNLKECSSHGGGCCSPPMPVCKLISTKK